jgi:hypothetical protein
VGRVGLEPTMTRSSTKLTQSLPDSDIFKLNTKFFKDFLSLKHARSALLQ